MKLEIITPEKVFFSGEVQLVTLPGTLGLFTLLDGHAPLVSSLRQGAISFRNEEGVTELNIESGFAEVNKNLVVVCTELTDEK